MTTLEQINSISLEAIFYDRFFRDRGVRRYSMLLQPKFSNEEKFELPRASIMHFLPESLTELGPSPQHLFLRRSVGFILAENVLEPTTRLGNPIKSPTPSNALEQQYRAQYRKIRPLKALETGLRDDRTIIVINYAMLDHLLRYRATYQTRVFKFTNKLETLVTKVNDLASKTTRQQFLSVRIPKVLPTKQQFIRGANALNRDTLKLFNDETSLLLLELWKWLSSKRDNSPLAKLTTEALDKLNLVLVESGKFTILNLGQLNSWRADPTVEGSQGYAPAQMQLAFLKFLENVQALRSVAAKTIIETTSSDSTDSESEEDSDEEEVVSIVVDGEEIQELERLEAEALEVDEDEIDNESSVMDDDEDGDVRTRVVPVVEEDSADSVEPPKDSDAPMAVGVIKASEALLEQGLISAAEHRRYSRLGASYESIPNPFGEGTLADAIKINPEDLKVTPTEIPDIPTVFDKSMLKSTLIDYDRTYIEKVFHADVAGMLLNVQNAGVSITDYRVQSIVDANNEYEIHEVKLTPVGGAPSTYRFKLPKLRPDGTYRAAGVNYRLRKQRGPLPIVKVNSERVALTSYYSKLFIQRSSKKVHDYGEWLIRQLNAMVETSTSLKVLAYGNFFNPTIVTPRTFSALARRFGKITYNAFEFVFSYDELIKQHGDVLVKGFLKNREIPVGKHNGQLLVMSETGNIYEPGSSTVHGTFEEIIGLPIQSAPVEVVELDIMGKSIPIGIVLGQHYGMANLLRLVKADARQVLRGSRLDLAVDEFAVKFADVSLVLSRENRLASLVMASFNNYAKSIALFELEEFENADVYAAVLEREGLGARYSRETDLMFQLYIDHITKELLTQMGEPTEFGPLLLRAVELLVSDQHPRETQGKLMRIKGYERFAGTVYGELVRGVRRYKTRPLTAKSKIDVNPNAVWIANQNDPAVSIIEQSNPIHNLKEKENVTYSGTGGRTSRTMVRRTRAFDPEDIGVISEATVDNSDVAVTVFLTANPKLADLRGVTSDEPLSYDETSSILSTNSLLSPDITRDDSKRALMSSIQASHVVAAKGYAPSPVRTGYESIVAHRTDDLYAYSAKAEGYIHDLGKDFVVIRYPDSEPSEVRVQLGRRYGVAAGSTVPHDVVCDLPKGHRFAKGDVLTFNTGFFDRDVLNPTQVVWKAGINSRVALMDTPDTLEDSCAISMRLADEMTINKTEVREIKLRFDQGIHNLVAIGERLETDSILCNIEDAITAGLGRTTDANIDTLSVMARNTPRAKFEGVVGNIEILYNGDLEDASESLRDVITDADKRRSKLAKQLKDGVAGSGSVVDIDIDTVVIKVYIDSQYGSGDGEKVVFGHQLKSVVRRIMVGRNESKSGLPIDAIFSYSSISNRIVNSPEVLGTTNVLMRLLSERMAKAYRGTL